jgi:hypothetical protein
MTYHSFPLSGRLIGPSSATPMAATSAEAAAPTNEDLAPDATASGQLVPGLTRVVRAPESSAISEAAKEVLRELVAGAELTTAVYSPPAVVVDSAAASAPESLSLWPTAPVDEVVPAASPILPALQAHDVPGSAAGVTSPEIQEVREGSGTGLLPEHEEGGAWISDLAPSMWTIAFEADTFSDEDEETAACRSLERGLLWARRAFDEHILPVTTVSPFEAVVYPYLFCSSKFCVRCTLARNRRSRSPTEGERTLLLMDKTRIYLRSASVWTYTFLTTGIP